ncbi:Pol, partial [Symbiodinium sp. CCMP2456]
HQVVVAGDMNATVQPAHPHVGYAVPKNDVPHHQDPDFQNLLMEHDLCALNTFHAKPAFTYVSTTSQSQIDFVLVRTKDARGGARTAQPIRGFPVTGGRLANHLPVQATIPMIPFQRQPAKRATPRPQFDVAALQLAVRAQPHSAQAQELRQAVATRVAGVSEHGQPDYVHQQINDILLEEVSRLFPMQPKPACRVSNHPAFRASATHTWALYRRMKGLAGRSIQEVWNKWRAYASFLHASRQLRQQSKQLKAAYHHDQLQQAEQAARVGDQRGLYRVIRQLAPRRIRGVSRLKGEDCHILSAPEELAAVIAYSKATFAHLPDDTPQQTITSGLMFSEADIVHEFAALNPYKAVPQHIAQNAAWRLCAGSLGGKLTEALNWHFRAGNPEVLKGDMRDTYVAWLPKPSKPPTEVGSLRPIGLMPPYPKILAGQLAQRIQWLIRPLLDHLPQYAYCAGRGCADAIFRVHRHFDEVDQLLKQNLDNRFKRRQGTDVLRCAGGACLSLDLSKAFDSVSRNLLTSSLQDLSIPADIVAAIQQLHKEACYHFDVRSQTGSATTTNGIKQGCRVAPILWVCFSISLMQGLSGHRDLAWVQRVLTLFADDFCACWTLTSKTDFAQAVRDIELLLELLTIFKLTVNYKKTAFLLRLEGKDAKRLLSSYVYQDDGQQYLRLSVFGKTQSLQIRDSHEYLGTKIAYKDRIDLNTAHRIEAAQHKYSMIRKVLNGRGPLSTGHKLRMWQACICTSLVYSLETVGLTAAGVHKLNVLATRHIRAITKQPAHITHVSNEDVWQASRLVPPGQLVLQRLRKFCATRDPWQSAQGPDIVTNDQDAASQAEVSQHVRLPCPHCDKAPVRHTFKAEAHSVAGMPTCKLCLRNFMKWRQLRLHVELGSCPILGGQSFKLHPVAPDNHLLRRQSAGHEKPVTTVQAEPQEQNFPDALPLVLDPSFHAIVPHWDRTMNAATAEAEIFRYCMPFGQAQGSAIKTEPQPDNPQSGNKRQRPAWPQRRPQRPTPGGYHVSQGTALQDPTVQIMGKLLLKHEQFISHLRRDMGYVMFFKQGEQSLIPSLMEVAKQHRAMTDAGSTDLQSPLGTLLLNCLLRELLQRAQTVSATEEGRNSLQQAQWMNKDGQWNYMRWDTKQRRLIPDTRRDPLSHENAIRTITELQGNMLGDIVHRFQSSQGFSRIEEEGHSQVTFSMIISLRHP